MKKFRKLILGLCAVLCLSVGAAADVIYNPVDAVPGGGWTILGVLAVIVVTVILILYLRKKR